MRIFFSLFALLPLLLAAKPSFANDIDTTSWDTEDNDAAVASEIPGTSDSLAQAGKRADSALEKTAKKPDSGAALNVNELQGRKKALNLRTLGFGPGIPGGMKTNKLTYNFYGGRIWEVAYQAAVRANGELITDFRKAAYLAGNLGMSYYPFKITQFSPYVGGEMGLGYVHRGTGDNAFGFNMGALAGTILFRTSDVQLSVELKGQILLQDFNAGAPASFSMRLGILF